MEQETLVIGRQRSNLDAASHGPGTKRKFQENVVRFYLEILYL